MTVIHELDRSLGLDLLLDTPGGETAATESLVDYLRSMFGSNMRAIVPQLAMSGGTMIACACNEITDLFFTQILRFLPQAIRKFAFSAFHQGPNVH